MYQTVLMMAMLGGDASVGQGCSKAGCSATTQVYVAPRSGCSSASQGCSTASSGCSSAHVGFLKRMHDRKAARHQAKGSGCTGQSGCSGNGGVSVFVGPAPQQAPPTQQAPYKK
jgi:hypothetical protein